MKEPRFDIKLVDDFIKGNITEEEFFIITTDKVGKSSYDLPVLETLKGDMNLFRKFLLPFSSKGRIRVLLRNQLVGMSLTSISDKYGINKNKLNYLKGIYKYPIKENPPGEIRPTIDYDIVSNELYSMLAIFCRVPVSWLRNDVPELIWSDKHFNDISKALFTIKEFYDYLYHIEEDALTSWIKYKEDIEFKKQKQTKNKNNIFYDIRGIVLTLNNYHQIYIRVAIYEYGGFIIEIFSENNELHDYTILKELLTRFGPIETGYFETIIEYRFNPVIICKSRSQKFELPPHLKSL